jgi:hypothetical protein
MDQSLQQLRQRARSQQIQLAVVRLLQQGVVSIGLVRELGQAGL